MPRTHQPGSKSGRSALSSPRGARSNAFLALAEAVQRRAEPRLERRLSAELRRAKRHGAEVEALVAAVRDLTLRGGKRLRPALVAAGLRTADATAKLDLAVELGLTLEMLHTYLLIHDDWMDGDALRRGGPTVHRLLARRFRSEERGAKSAVLAGDYALGLALELFASSRAGASRPALLRALVRMHNDAIVGQELDIAASAPDPERVYALKTGSYTVNGPLAIGALLGGGKPALLRALERFALPAGIAFQLRDDLLGAFGEPAVTGKARGSDLTAGKYTALVKAGLSRAKGRDRARLTRVFGKPRARGAEVSSALSVLEQVGARAEVEQRILELCKKARRALASRAVGEGGRALLEGALEALAERPL